MKKSLILFSVFAAIAACNGGLGEKGRTLARIDGKAFTEKDLEERLSTLPEDQFQAILKSPEDRRQHFEQILQGELFALAGQQSKIGNHDSLEHRLAIIDERVITQYYFETYINEYGAQTYQQLQDFYHTDSTKFLDSGKVMPFSKIIGRVADARLIAHANLDSFYEANRNMYLDKAHCNASLIQTATRKEAEIALDAVKGGIPFSDAAIKYSNYFNKKSGGGLGRIDKGAGSSDIGSLPVVDSLLFDPATRLKAGQIAGPIARSGSFILVRADSCQSEDVLPPLNQMRGRVEADYVQAYKAQRAQRAVADLRTKYGVRLISPTKTPTEDEIKTYYDQNKDSYQSPETFELYDIEVANKDKVLARFKAVKDLNAFKALASQVSENTLTKTQSGYLGVVKRDFCLPYGVGMLPDLFPALDSLTQGKVTDPLQSPDTQKWHFFWLVKKEPSQTKPLERVHALVKLDLEANRVTNIQPQDSLAVLNNGRVFREDDVLFLKEELPPQMRERYTRESLVDFLITWQVASDEAKALGMTKDERLVGLRLQNTTGFWSQFYQGTVQPLSYEDDTTLLAKTFAEKKSLFVRDLSQQDWHPYTHDIAAYLTLTPHDFDIEYNTNPERYPLDSLHKDMSAYTYEVFQNLKPAAYSRLDAQILGKLKARYKVHLVDPALEEPTLEPTAQTYKKAQDLHYDRKLDQALSLYGKLRDAYPNRAGLQDSIGFGVAQIYIEQERYPQALAEYRRISYLYPNSPNNYKAMFMVGFIYSEHLKNDSAAVQAFEKMLVKYPKSDLSDDADWMIRNIRSGGKLMPKLQDDTTSTAPKK